MEGGGPREGILAAMHWPAAPSIIPKGGGGGGGQKPGCSVVRERRPPREERRARAPDVTRGQGPLIGRAA